MKIFKNTRVPLLFGLFLIKSRASGGSALRTPYKCILLNFFQNVRKHSRNFYQIIIKFMQNWPKIVIFIEFLTKNFENFFGVREGGGSAPGTSTNAYF